VDKFYPVKTDRREKIVQLYNIFGSDTTLSRETIERELDRNNGDFNKTVDSLLQMSIKPLNTENKYLNPEEQIKMKNLETVHNMFGGELSRSIISVVYLQNQGDIATTVDTLLDISHDDEAIEAIRNMSSQQKLKLEDDMKLEQDRRLKERKDKLEQELDIERKQLAHLAQQQKQSFPPNSDPSQELEVDKREKEIQDEVSRLTDGIAQKEFIVSKISQQAALCTLSVRYGIKTIVVSWSLGEDMTATVGDWIGFYKVGQPIQKYKRYIKTVGSRKGHETVLAPKTPGLYHFKYFVDGSYNEVCISDVIHIGPQLVIKSNLIEDPDDVKKNEIEVNYTLKGGELSSNDWFGLYSALETNNKNYISYYRLGDPNNKINCFKLPAPRLPGDYTIKFFPSLCGYNFVSKSNAIRIINKDKLDIQLIPDSNNNGRLKSIKVSWDILSVDINTYDYIGLYKQDSLNNYYDHFQYVDVKSGYMFFEAPKEVAVYHFRYHSVSYSKYIDIARSESFTIQNTDSINAIYNNGDITVTWDIHSQPHTKWDWVGIFKVGAANNDYVIFKYVEPNSNTTTIQNIPSGTYEARYFSSKVGKYTDFRKSSTFSY